DEVIRKRDRLGIAKIALVDNLPVISAAFGYTRRSPDPIYDEDSLNAKGLSAQIRPFLVLDQTAGRRLDRLDVVGTVPILARESDHEGIFLSLRPEKVVSWLHSNGVATLSGTGGLIGRVLSQLENVDKYHDKIWELTKRRLVFGLVHSLSHAAMR